MENHTKIIKRNFLKEIEMNVTIYVKCTTLCTCHEQQRFRSTSSSIVALNLHHPPIPARLGSEILHERTNGVGEKKGKGKKEKEKRRACWVCFSLWCFNYNYS